jgi:hypothetical protein
MSRTSTQLRTVSSERRRRRWRIVACGRLAQSLLYGVGPTDPATLAGSAAAIVLVAGVAAAIPAYRAATIDPAAALRSE